MHLIDYQVNLSSLFKDQGVYQPNLCQKSSSLEVLIQTSVSLLSREVKRTRLSRKFVSRQAVTGVRNTTVRVRYVVIAHTKCC